MAAVYVDLGSIGPEWPTACRTAVAHLNQLFTQNSIGVSLAFAGKGGPRIAVRTDPRSKGRFTAHLATETTSGQLLSAVVSLPVKASINTPQGMREAGAGVRCRSLSPTAQPRARPGRAQCLAPDVQSYDPSARQQLPPATALRVGQPAADRSRARHDQPPAVTLAMRELRRRPQQTPRHRRVLGQLSAIYCHGGRA